MNHAYDSDRELRDVAPTTNVFAPFFALLRFLPALYWVLSCYAAVRFADVLSFAFPSSGRALRYKISRMWIERMPSLLGLRITVRGMRPEHPYFLVNNHITWLDFLAMNSLCDARCVAMDELRTIPIVGTLVKGLNPIFVKRVRHCTPAVLAEMNKALDAGASIQMAPEGVISPGRAVKRFRAALLESAVRAGLPIHYASITYRTPPNCLPASRVVLFGPDPHYVPAPGEVSDEELEAWGPKRTFLGHVLTLLSQPWTEVMVCFAAQPIYHNDAKTLANDLQRAVQKIFTPVD